MKRWESASIKVGAPQQKDFGAMSLRMVRFWEWQKMACVWVVSCTGGSGWRIGADAPDVRHAGCITCGPAHP